MSKYLVKTPCIGVCSTGIGDFVCRGCRRFAHEVIDWNSYSYEEKRCVLERIESLLGQVVQTKCTIIDQQRLKRQLSEFKIPYLAHRQTYCWIYDLLKAASRQLENLNGFGVEVFPEYQAYSMTQLKQLIDDELQILSEAHYERYFTQPIQILAEET